MNLYTIKKQVSAAFLLLSFSLIAVSASAQSKVIIRGTIVDKQTRENLPFVNIVEMDKDNRFVSAGQTDSDGKFVIKISNEPGTKLSFSYIGYEKQTIPVGTTSVFNILLQPNEKQLKEVAVVGRKSVNDGMMNIKERNMTVAYSKINAKDLEDLQVTSIDDALQGRMAGVDIVASSGEPGAGMSIRIRGTTSINSSSDPLIVVDGIPLETEIDESFDFATADEEQYATLLNVAPADIEEIVVLKDAAATAIWGSRGANGVLQIKTKRGTIGKPKVQYSFKGTAVKPQDAIPTLSGDQYTTLIMEAKQNTAEAGVGTVMNPLDDPEFFYDPKNPYYYYNFGQNTDWADAVTKDGFTHDHTVSLTGGGEKARYRMSLGYLSQDGTVIGQSYERLTSRVNLDYFVSDKVRFSADIAYTYGDKKGNYASDVLSKSYTKMPNQSIYEYTLDGEITSVYFSPETTPQGTWNATKDEGIYNTVAMATSSTNRVLSERIVPTLTVQYQILPETFRYQLDVAFDINNTKTNKFLPQIATGSSWYESSVNRSSDTESKSFAIQTFNKLYWTPKLGEDHELVALAAFTTKDSRSESQGRVSSNTASIFLQDTPNSNYSGTEGTGISSSSSQVRTMSLLANVNYAWLDRYIFGSSVGYEGNSKFGINYRYGLFPSFSARWRISNEPFMKSFDHLNELSLRASYGINGNAPKGNYLSYSMYDTYSYQYMGQNGVYAENMSLDNLRWEKATQYNLGLNYVGFNNRINIDLEVYRKRTSDLYFKDVALPSTSGYSDINMNVGTMDNQGWEFSVMTTPFRSKDWKVDFNFNIARSVNIIRELSEYISLESGVTTTNGQYLSVIEIGQPLGSFYGYVYDGVYLNESETIAKDKNGGDIYDIDGNPVYMKFGYPSIDYQFQAGDARYKDINNDGNINDLDIVYLGDANPLFTGGFGPTVTYKNWTLASYFYFRYGNEIVNYTRMEMENMYDYDNQSTAVLRRWKRPYENAEDAPDNLLPRALFGSGYNWLGSSRYVEDGSFLRWKSLTISYRFPKQWLKRFGISDLKLNFTAQNIHVWTNYTGMDPEVSISSTDIYTIGYDKTRSPKAKEFALGATISF
jgi:TonB-linked SusC/RagA family outer membrane protein